jgi:hypothetical protein
MSAPSGVRAVYSNNTYIKEERRFTPLYLPCQVFVPPSTVDMSSPTGGCLALSYHKGTPPPSSKERNFLSWTLQK